MLTKKPHYIRVILYVWIKKYIQLNTNYKILASKNGHYGIVKLLLNSGAETNAKNKLGETPLHKAISAPYENRKNILLILVNNKADVNIRNNAKNTPLQEVENILIFSNSNISNEIDLILGNSINKQEYKFILDLLSPVKSQACLIL